MLTNAVDLIGSRDHLLQSHCEKLLGGCSYNVGMSALRHCRCINKTSSSKLTSLATNRGNNTAHETGAV